MANEKLQPGVSAENPAETPINETETLDHQEAGSVLPIEQNEKPIVNSVEPVMMGHEIFDGVNEKIQEIDERDSSRSGGLPPEHAKDLLLKIINNDEFDVNNVAALTDQLIAKAKAEMQKPEHQN